MPVQPPHQTDIARVAEHYGLYGLGLDEEALAGVLLVILSTPQCAVPVLAHGTTTPDPSASRILIRENRIDVPGFGVLSAAGVYATVQHPGTLTEGAEVTV